RSAARAAASAAGFLALALLRPLGLAALAPAAAAAATAAFRAAPAFHVVLAFGAETVPLALLARQSRRRAFGDVEIGVEVVRGVVRLDRVAQVEAVGLDDDLPAGQVFPRQEGHRDAGGAGAAGAADPVHVRLGLFGGVVVDDVRDVGDVDAAGGDVGGDEHVDLAGAERPQGPLAGVLAQVAVDRSDREPAEVQFVGEFLGGPLGAAEEDGQAAAPRLQDPGDHFDLVERVRLVHQLARVRDRLLVGAGHVRGHRDGPVH